MSTSRIREALSALKSAAHASGHDGMWNLALAAEEEVEVIEKAARVVAPADYPNVLPRDDAERAWDLIRRIAREAP